MVVESDVGMLPVRLGRGAAWLAKQVEIGLADVGLSLSQYRMLSLLSEGSAMGSALAERLAVKPPSVSAMVDGMVSRGFVERQYNHDDRRTVRLDITPAGTKELDRADQAVQSRLEMVAGCLDDKQDTERILDAMTLWYEAMQAERRARQSTA